MLDPGAPGPILTAHLFPTLDAQLIDLLSSLGPEDWERQTVAARWKVKDVAAHLLDTQLRRLSFGRDGYACGGDWHLDRGEAWMLVREPVGTVASTVTIPQDIAWRLFTKGMARDKAREHVRVEGDTALGTHVLAMLAIVG